MAEVVRKVTGYQLREAIKRWELRKSTAAKQFQEALWVFPGEDKPAPPDLSRTYVQAEEAVARLQTVQAQYNLAVVVNVLGTAMTLLQAVKMLGGAGRHEKMWRTAASGDPRYNFGMQLVRQKDQEHAKRAVGAMEAIARTDEAAKFASALRSAIALGNGQEREMVVPAELLEV